VRGKIGSEGTVIERGLPGIVVVLASLGLVASGCGDSGTAQDEPRGEPKRDVREAGGLDPRPEKVNGVESDEFEQQDLTRARNAGRLVELYCEGAESEAQYEGCLSHVLSDDVCAQDSPAKQTALTTYIEETGDSGICG
jgi:hypothetical protein